MNSLRYSFLSEEQYMVVITGSKEDITHAGYATPEMFPRGGLNAQKATTNELAKVSITRTAKGEYEVIWMPHEPLRATVRLPYHLAAVALRLVAWADCDLAEGREIAPGVTKEDIEALESMFDDLGVYHFTPEIGGPA